MYNFFRRFKSRSKAEVRVEPWFKIDGDMTLRLDYDELDTDSVVFDLGGYKGQWTSDIYAKYGCSIYVFEPVHNFYHDICERFKKNKKVKVFCYGLAEENKELAISISKDGSSIFRNSSSREKDNVTLVRACSFFHEQDISLIDLMKINIEGGEYDLLEHLIKEGFIENIRNLQIQFHDFVPDAEIRMKNIKTALAKTHKLTYEYEFVWENWKLINNI